MRPGRIIFTTSIGAITWLGPASCVRPPQPDTPTAANVANADLEALWDASLRVLHRMDMQPERQDRATGVIETLPTTTKQFWEFWRDDCADSYGQTLADVQTIQRRAIVRFRRLAPESRWQVDVQVDVFRLQRPERQLTSTSSVLEAYSSLLPTTEGQIAGRSELAYLEPMGRDGAMEQQILRMIMRQSQTLDFDYAEFPTTQIASAR